MVEKVNANALLFGKMHGEQLEITAFKYNGKIIANRMHLEWDKGMKDLSFGEIKDFADEKAVEDYVKVKVIPWLNDTILPGSPTIETKVCISQIQIGG